MGLRTLQRFRTSTIVMHWLHTALFFVMIITGALMFFQLTGLSGGRHVRTAHRITALCLVAAQVLYALFDPRTALGFLAEACRWDRDDIGWLKQSPRYYCGGQVQMPPQGRINGDQKLWQLVVILSGGVLTLTGGILWFFKLKVPTEFYAAVLLTHAGAFVAIALMFPAHFYLRALHPIFGESLSSMLDGKVSSAYAARHYPKWHAKIVGRPPEKP
jgi:formate dehydrogenase gamma subunit